MSNISVNTITDASGGSTASINGLTPQPSNMQPFNRIINGAMTVDQRNAGAAVNLSGSSVFPVDRMLCFGRASGTGITGQRSTVAPAGYTNSLLYTVTTGATPTGSDYPQVGQIIEGYNVAELGYGTANAQTVTISFWVRSSVTGIYGFCVQNGALNRSYVAQYTINSADTWEYKTITVSGDTSGTWATNNAAGFRIVWDMGFGFGETASPNTWQTNQRFSVSGNVKLAATTGATFYITGVQLEAGSSASPFAHENYGDTLQKCQRYYQIVAFCGGAAINTTTIGVVYTHPVTMRTVPTRTLLTSTPYAEWPNNVGYTASGAGQSGTSSDTGSEFRISGFSGMVAGKAPMWFAANQMSLSSEL